MQDYKRIVSYIYAYENNQKKNNAGFAKLEARSGNGRMMLRINGSGSLDDDELEVYFLHIDDYHEGIKVGECRARSGQVMAELKINTEDIGGTGLDLSKIHGLYFRTKKEPEKVFASSWINDDLNLRRFRVFEAGTVEEVAVEEEDVRAAVLQDEVATFFEALEKYEEKEAEIQEEQNAESIEDVEAESICNDNCRPDSECEEEHTLGEKRSKWENLCCSYPKVIAFEDDMKCMCLKVDIKDIELILGRSFRMAPNSFAIRSYMRFHYLLLIENNSDGNTCILGAPGFYNNNDNMVAKMCGFDEFRPSKHVEKMNGCFGYWLKVMEL